MTDLRNDEEEEANKELRLHEGIQKIYTLIHEGVVLESPIDIHIPNAIALELPPLEWHHMELEPKRVKLTNSGHTGN